MGSPAIFNGSFVRFLKDDLNLNNTAYILTSTNDPTSVATNAPRGSLLLKTSSPAALYRKNDTGSSTNWSIISSFIVNTVTTTPTSLSVYNDYIINSTSLIYLDLPSTFAVGDIIRIIGKGTGGWILQPASGDNIIRDTFDSGVNGSLTSSYYTSCIELIGTTANATWTVRNSQGATQAGLSLGYWMGGRNSGGSEVTTVEKLAYSTETRTTTSDTLDTARRFAAPGVSTIKGYHMGGNPGSTTTIEAIVFTTEAIAAISATLPGGKNGNSGASSTTKAYSMGGDNGVSATSSIYSLTFSGESTATVANSLGSNKQDLCSSTYSSTKGYVMGGYVAGAVTSIDALTYSGETTAVLSAVLSSARFGQGGVWSSTKAYCLGGDTGGGSAINNINALVFSGETCGSIGATLSSARTYSSGIIALDRGYVGGGRTSPGGDADSVNTIDSLIYSAETCGAISSTLSAAKGHMCGVYH